MRAESTRAVALRMLLEVDQIDDRWWEAVYEALEMHRHPHSPDLSDLRLLWASNLTEWGECRKGMLAGKPGNAIILECDVWHRPDGAPAMVEAGVWDHGATRMARLALYAALMRELQVAGLVSYITTGTPPKWRHCQVYHRGDRLDHVIWADALIQRACVWNRRGTFQEPGELPALVLRGSIVIEPGSADLGFF